MHVELDFAIKQQINLYQHRTVQRKNLIRY